MPFSDKQQKRYRILVAQAYAEEAARLQGELPRKEEWRRQFNVAITGHYSTQEMNRTDDYDKIMFELAILANDDRQIAYFSAAAERRIGYIIKKQFLPDLEYLEQTSIDWKYIQGICKQMHVPDNINDCPAELLLKVLWALDTHIRRLARKAGIELIDLPSGYFRKGFRADEAKARWHHDHHHHIRHGEAA